MNRVYWGLQILAVTVFAVSAVMLARDWMQPSGDDVVIAVDVPANAQGGSEYPLVMRIRNTTRSDIRIVGMNWCWGGNCTIRSDHKIPLTIAANSEMPLEMGITPVMKGEFGQLFHFYLDVGNVLVTKVIEFKGVCVADAPAIGENAGMDDGS